MVLRLVIEAYQDKHVQNLYHFLYHETLKIWQVFCLLYELNLLQDWDPVEVYLHHQMHKDQLNKMPGI